MATRERNRYCLCHLVAEKYEPALFKPEHILFAFRQSLLSQWGELALATFGTNSKIVVSSAGITGFFVIRFPSKAQSECLLALSLIMSISSRPVTVRCVQISGRLKNIVKVASEKLLEWRNNLTPEYAIPRKEFLDRQLRELLKELHSLPDYV